MKSIFIIILVLFTILIIGILSLKNIIKIIYNEEVEIKNGSLDFQILNEKMFIWTKVNGQSVKLQLDTGATQHYINDISLFQNKDGIVNSFKTTLSDNSKLSSSLCSIRMDNNIVSGKPMTVNYINKKTNECDESKGFFSLTNFIDHEKEILLNFETNQVVSQNMKEHSKIGYTEISMNADISGLIKIKLNINGNEDWFIFDTGALTTVIYTKDRLRNYSMIRYKVMTGDHMKLKTITTFENVPVYVGPKSLTVDINNSEHITRQIIGILFIKHFNWILDFKNNKAYFKKIDKEHAIKSFQQLYTCRVVNKKLMISSKREDLEGYDIGDEILSVNGINITKDNICAFQKQLNTTKDWTTLNIRIK